MFNLSSIINIFRSVPLDATITERLKVVSTPILLDIEIERENAQKTAWLKAQIDVLRFDIETLERNIDALNFVLSVPRKYKNIELKRLTESLEKAYLRLDILNATLSELEPVPLFSSDYTLENWLDF